MEEIARGIRSAKPEDIARGFSLIGQARADPDRFAADPQWREGVAEVLRALRYDGPLCENDWRRPFLG